MNFLRHFLITIPQASFMPLGVLSFNAQRTSGKAALAAGNHSPIPAFNNTLAAAYSANAAAKASELARQAALLAKTGDIAASLNVNVGIGAAVKNTASTGHSTTEWLKPASVYSAGGIDWKATGGKGEGIITIGALNVKSNGPDHFDGNQLIFDDLITHNTNQSTTHALAGGASLTYGTQGLGGQINGSGSKSHETFDSTTHNGTNYDGQDAVFNIKEHTTNNNSNIKFESSTGNMGQLILNSAPDTRDYRYDSESGAFNYTTGGIPSLTGTKTAIDANYNAVNSQAVLDLGAYNVRAIGTDPTQAGFINNGGQLLGDANPANNHLTTNAIITQNVNNSSNYNLDSASISTATGTGAPPTHQTEHNSSITHASMSDAHITITDPSLQQQLTGQSAQETIANLNHDTTANIPLVDVFNKDTVQQDLAQTQAISTAVSSIANEIKGWETINNTAAIINAQNQHNTLGQQRSQTQQALAEAQQQIAENHADGSSISADELANLNSLVQQLNQIDKNMVQLQTTININQNEIKDWSANGSKGQYLTSIQNALTAGLTGQSALASTLAGTRNLLAEQLHNDDGEVTAERVMGHAILACTVALVGGGDCGTAAAGAVGSVVAAPLIGQILYPDVKVSDYTEAQKQVISSLTTVSAGLVAGATGSGTLEAIEAADAAKNEVENNAFGLEGWKGQVSDGALKTLEVCGYFYKPCSAPSFILGTADNIYELIAEQKANGLTKDLAVMAVQKVFIAKLKTEKSYNFFVPKNVQSKVEGVVNTTISSIADAVFSIGND